MEEMKKAKSKGEAMEKGMMKVMVALDNSEESFYALRWVLDHLYNSSKLATEADAGFVTLVHVRQPPSFIVSPCPGGGVLFPRPRLMDSTRKAVEENSIMVISHALQMCNEHRVRAETLILDGEPKDMLCRITKEMHTDLLVLGSRGIGKIERALLGSVSDYCVHHAKSSVLIVKPSMKDNK